MKKKILHLHVKAWIYSGYPKSGDADRIKRFQFKWPITKEITHEQFGPKQVLVYAVDLSSPIPNG